MDRPVHKCSDMPKFAEAWAMQAIARSLQENVDWRDGRDVQQHLAFGPLVGVEAKKADGNLARVWRWIPREVAYEVGFPQYSLS